MQWEGYASRVSSGERDECVAWQASKDAQPSPPQICASRDVFQARLDGLLRELPGLGWPSGEAALLIATLGELGNNSFDHNLGQWADAPGCWFGRDPGAQPPLFWIADRGVGILATLRRADAMLVTPQQAMDAAFSRVLSGRTPERRGNGLKFVRSVVNGHASRALVCHSHGGMAEFGGLTAALAGWKQALHAAAATGVATVVAWSPRT